MNLIIILLQLTDVPSVLKNVLLLSVSAVVLAAGIVAMTPLIFAGRVLPGVAVGEKDLTGISFHDLPLVLEEYSAGVGRQKISLTLRGQAVEYELAALGVGLKRDELAAAISDYTVVDIARGHRIVQPLADINRDVLSARIEQDFVNNINSPVNASLKPGVSGQWELAPSQTGEVVDTSELARDIETLVSGEEWGGTIVLVTVSRAAAVQDEEVDGARRFADILLSRGFNLVHGNETFVMNPYIISGMLVFVEQVDPANFNNRVLGVKFDSGQLLNYLDKTILPAVNREAVNARFELATEGLDERVEQFALPQSGQALDVTRTVNAIAVSLAHRYDSAQLAVNVSSPDIAGLNDINALGVTALLAVGESDFAGSPNNRRHNITIGADKYHGLLIPPKSEFSFNNFLGPVTAAAGFKPELVIKNNVTTPEFGGGLCQVSTTLFRAALNAGLEVTQRRNHAYIVRYYGEPGLDATIYPPYTDLRFLNNTPGYILIQAKIEGTKLAFQFWGTSDDRQVDIKGPVTYARRPDGAASAYVEQRVTVAGQKLVDATFYSRYKSPKLFPKVLAANGERNQ